MYLYLYHRRRPPPQCYYCYYLRCSQQCQAFSYVVSCVFPTCCRAARQRQWALAPLQHQSGTPCESRSCFLQSCVTLLCFIFICPTYKPHPLRQQIWVPAAGLAWSGEPDLLRPSSLSLLQSVCNHFVTWNSIFLNVDDYVWGHGSHFLIHEEIANTEGQCCTILLPEFLFCSFFFFYFFFLLLQYSYCGKTFCSVFMSHFQCKLSVLVTKHILLHSVMLCSCVKLKSKLATLNPPVLNAWWDSLFVSTSAAEMTTQVDSGIKRVLRKLNKCASVEGKKSLAGGGVCGPLILSLGPAAHVGVQGRTRGC